MQVSGEDVQVWIALPEALVVFIQRCLGLFPDLGFRTGVVLVSNLQDQLMKGLLLLSGSDLFIIIIDPPVRPCLLGVIPFQGFIEEFVVDLFDRFITVIDIEVLKAYSRKILSLPKSIPLIHAKVLSKGLKTILISYKRPKLSFVV